MNSLGRQSNDFADFFPHHAEWMAMDPVSREEAEALAAVTNADD